LTVLQMDRYLLARLLSSEDSNLDLESFSPDLWRQIVTLSEREGVGPQLYWALSTSAKISILPKACHDRLRAMFAATRLNNIQSLHQLEILTDWFGQAGIPVVALKGICFALTIYPDLGLRPMDDLDLLVPSSRMPEAIKIACHSGYEKALPEAVPGLDELLNHAACLSKTQFPFTKLELHHTLVGDSAYRYAVQIDWLWTQTELLQINSNEWVLGNLLILSPTAQLLYACAHAMLQHGGRDVSLRWTYDLDRMIHVHSDRLDWELLSTQAQSYTWGSAVRAALFQVVSLFHTPVPQMVLDKFAAYTDGNTERIVEMESPPGTHTLEEYQKFRALKKGRIKMFIGLAVPSPVYMRWRYGLNTNHALPIWYVYRCWCIVKDGAKTIVYLLRTSASGH
jgi:hypothetical protein